MLDFIKKIIVFSVIFTIGNSLFPAFVAHADIIKVPKNTPSVEISNTEKPIILSYRFVVSETVPLTVDGGRFVSQSETFGLTKKAIASLRDISSFIFAQAQELFSGYIEGFRIARTSIAVGADLSFSSYRNLFSNAFETTSSVSLKKTSVATSKIADTIFFKTKLIDDTLTDGASAVAGSIATEVTRSLVNGIEGPVSVFNGAKNLGNTLAEGTITLAGYVKRGAGQSFESYASVFEGVKDTVAVAIKNTPTQSEITSGDNTAPVIPSVSLKKTSIAISKIADTIFLQTKFVDDTIIDGTFAISESLGREVKKTFTDGIKNYAVVFEGIKFIGAVISEGALAFAGYVKNGADQSFENYASVFSGVKNLGNTLAEGTLVLAGYVKRGVDQSFESYASAFEGVKDTLAFIGNELLLSRTAFSRPSYLASASFSETVSSVWCDIKGLFGFDNCVVAGRESLTPSVPLVKTPEITVTRNIPIGTETQPRTEAVVATVRPSNSVVNQVLSFDAIVASLKNVFAPLSTIGRLERRIENLEGDIPSSKTQSDILSLQKRVDSLTSSNVFNPTYTYTPTAMVGGDGKAVVFNASGPNGVFENGITSQTGVFSGGVTAGSYSGAWSGNAIGVGYGGTGTTTLSGILAGNGTLGIKSAVLGAGLSYDGTTLTMTSSASSTILTDNNTWSGINNFTANTGFSVASPSYKLDVAGFINTDQYSGYKQAGNTVLYASTTNGSVSVGSSGAADWMSATSSVFNSIAIGYQALNTVPISGDATSSTAIGYKALSFNTTGYYNSANGANALQNNTTGYENTANGAYSLNENTTGYQNTAIGVDALQKNISGYQNVAIGGHALQSNLASVNTAVGYYALSSNTTGTFNTANGHSALFNNTAGIRNTADGVYSLTYNTTGGYNTANGMYSLYNNTTSSYNTASGYGALQTNSTGSNSTASGYYSLFYNTIASSSVAFGYQTARGPAAYSNQGGVYIGANAGYSAATGSDYNTLLGYNSGYGVTTGANNILLGANAGYSGTNLTTGSNNIIIGYNIGATSTDMTKGLNIGNLLYGTGLDGSGTTLSTGNIGIGTTTPLAKLSVKGIGTTTGINFLTTNSSDNPLFAILDSGNVGISSISPSYKLDVAGFINTDQYSGYKQAGNTVLYSSTTNFSLAVGASSAATWMSATSSAFYSIAVGYQALNATPTSGTAQYNTAMGYQSLYSGTTGGGNSAYGAVALRNNTTGNYNSALGSSALTANTTGSNNSAQGYLALSSNTTGSNNSAQGAYALRSNTTGIYNSAQGYQALRLNTVGGGNSAQGVNTLYANITGLYNSAQGYQALYYNQSATSTTAIGAYASQGTANYSNQGGVYIGYQSGYSAATGSDYNTLLGYNSGYGVTTGARNVFLGNSTIAASYNQVTTGSNNISIGNDVAVASTTASNQLNIGNLIYGTGLDGTGATLSAGNIGIGTTTPWGKFSIDPNNILGPEFVVGSSTQTHFIIDTAGNVGIGTTSPTNKLEVNGNVFASSFIDDGITIAAPDYVFDDPEYKLLTMDEIQSYIDKNKHLPWLTARGSGAMSLSKRINEILEGLENLWLKVFDLIDWNKAQDDRIRELEQKIQRLEEQQSIPNIESPVPSVEMITVLEGEPESIDNLITGETESVPGPVTNSPEELPQETTISVASEQEILPVEETIIDTINQEADPVN